MKEDGAIPPPVKLLLDEPQVLISKILLKHIPCGFPYKLKIKKRQAQEK